MFIQLALVQKFHIILPVQTNREGYKVNRSDDKRFIDMGDAAESFGIMAEASNVITINRSTGIADKNLICYHVTKCRSKRIGCSYLSETRLDIARTHHPSFRSMAMPPGMTVETALATWVKQDNDQRIAEIQSDVMRSVNQEFNTIVTPETTEEPKE